MRIGIVGGGIFGISAAHELALRGHAVELFERGRIPAEGASSTDISKVIRMEYGAASELYLPLVERALELWAAVERRSGQRLLHPCGVLFLASAFDPGRFEWHSVEALRARGHRPEVLDAQDAARRWPQFDWRALQAGIFNPEGGWLEASRAIETLAHLARGAGAVLHEDCPVEAVDESASAARLQVAGSSRAYDAVLVAAGAWVLRLLPALAGRARVSRQQISFYRPARLESLREPAFPVWIHDMREEGWYGFPANGEGLVKVALHRRSETVEPDVPREADANFLEASRRFVAAHLPALEPASQTGGKVCLYTNSPRGDLAFDRVPGSERICVAGLGSGHGFKFGPVLGELAAGLIERDEVPAALRLGAPRDQEVW